MAREILKGKIKENKSKIDEIKTLISESTKIADLKNILNKLIVLIEDYLKK